MHSLSALKSSQTNRMVEQIANSLQIWVQKNVRTSMSDVQQNNGRVKIEREKKQQSKYYCNITISECAFFSRSSIWKENMCQNALAPLLLIVLRFTQHEIRSKQTKPQPFRWKETKTFHKGREKKNQFQIIFDYWNSLNNGCYWTFSGLNGC